MKLASALLLAAILPVHAQFTSGQPADLVLGQVNLTSAGAGSGRDKFDGPGDVAIDPVTGAVFVADRNNNRVVRFSSANAMINGGSADVVLGQPDFATVLPGNSATEMSFPTDVNFDSGGRLWVVDSGNNRVLRFDNAATIASEAAADGILGQSGFGVSTAGIGLNKTNVPTALTTDADGTLWVTELNNNRVLRFDNAAAKAIGGNADGVLGQPNFVTAVPGSDEDSLDGPRGVAISNSGALFVSDGDNNRIVRFDNAALKNNGDDADQVLGQTNLNGSISSGTTRTAFNTPGNLALDSAENLFVIDSQNFRVIAFANAALTFDGAPAFLVLGQSDFNSSTGGNTAFRVPFPAGLAFDTAGRLFVAQSLPNRVTRFSPAIPPTPSPAPAVDSTPPTIKVKGRRSVDSLRNRVVFRGTATDADAIAGIEFRVSGQAGFQQARGTTRWKAVVRPNENKRKTVVRVRAIDAAGNKSSFLKLKIFRR